MSLIKFTKMHGLGNDFMVVNGVTQDFHPTPALICKLADRHTGIGFDQLLIVEPTPDKTKADFFYRIFNADGSEAAQCGNGARCIAKFIREQNLALQDEIKVATKAGILELYTESAEKFRVNMGVPVCHPDGLISLGNLHRVQIVPDIKQAPVAISSDTDINMGFMKIENPQHIYLRVNERGVGETLGCGSGACAAVVAGRMLGKLDEQVTVTLPGGDLVISWAGEGTPVWMTGPAVTVFDGICSEKE